MGKFATIIDKLQTLSKTQKIVTSVVTAASVAIVGGGAVLVSSIGNQDASASGTETTEFSIDTEATEVIGEITVSIETTSIYQDLKIKIVDENGNLVSGFPFEITVAPKEDVAEDLENDDVTEIDGEDYADEDMDGMVHIQEIEGGDYVVFLQEMEGIIVTEKLIEATVKGELEYKKVDNENEIKEDDVEEDTAENDVVVEAVVEDTLPLLESTITPVEVAKSKVDFSNFPSASVSDEVNSATLNQIKKTVVSSSRISSAKASKWVLISTKTAENSENNTTEETSGSTESSSGSTESSSGSTEPSSGSTEPSSGSTEPSTGETESSSGSEESGSGSSEPDNEGESNESTEDTVVASATVKLPKSVQLYYYGNESSTKAKVSLSVSDSSGIIVSDGIIWSISDKNVAELTVAEDNKSATLVAKTSGTAVINVKITYTSDSNGATTTSELSCNVNVGDYTDTTTQLKSTDKKKLYLDGKAQTIATPASYATATTFYTAPKYTGWQTINGKLYYYTADNKPAVGYQVIGGVQYTFNSDGSLIPSTQTYGIDVSKWQGNIDWTAVANSGVKFAIIRCAYRGATDGLIHEDPYFKKNIKGATQNGIKVGVYFFTQAINEVEAIEEASMAIGLVSGYYLNLPIFIDTERATNGRANGLSVEARTRVVKAFCETVRNSGYKPGIYASMNWYYNNLNMSQLSAYNIWVAQYNTSCSYTGKYDLWQYSQSGSVPGISGKVDLNMCYTNY